MRYSQHRRSLATGLFAAAIAPIAVGILLLFVLTGGEMYILEMVAPISLIGLLISIPSTLLGALPLFLVLRHKSILSGPLLCLGCGIIGAASIVIITLANSSRDSAHQFGTDHIGIAFFLIVGFACGAVAGLALSLGAGVPFWEPSDNNNART
jgi:hypothetical protein